ncbi:bifunctional methylenetetrahydrofolate dehydrogenase/methenyltetrahydrofolate cyclohydrolase FolD [Neorhizobium sp. JUb45]|uniref:bifunctional methylenetetrahydrofolate dehydrogenase/methenyltetrahydrofolate cyclohydrolase FolD n=1 Tax=unclassified Neorhizobium TaxID=2629175 RepID=UPI0010506A09|nr:bifunctional methylenetetrahydrofolate dehydrogenase/methenyltetrahydrofolate cyclohydrolase FolD [Neorhizobium sp. JUb45]TCR04004.1 methenyltetrahydrofolate cyclohydrolase /5,10-methylenetetrahydrofolate dehydrogenase (NADP+) [Neorhizobium sp. JUb45]
MATVIDGKLAAEKVIATVTQASATLESEKGVRPGLAVVIVGDDAASHTYVAAKSRMAKQCGFNSIQHSLPGDTTQEALEALVSELNADPAIHGILVQLPLPKNLDSERVTQLVAPEKDVDGLHVVNAGKIATGDFETGLVSCTPAGSMLLVKQILGEDLSGLNAVVIGRSNLFGKPMALLLLAANATVTMAHSRSKDLASICKNADILVAAVGRSEMVKADWVKPGATIIDVGINRIPAPEKGEGKTRLVGDVAFAECAEVANAITPVPGGVGPMTIAMLMANTVVAASRALGVAIPKF